MLPLFPYLHKPIKRPLIVRRSVFLLSTPGRQATNFSGSPLRLRVPIVLRPADPYRVRLADDIGATPPSLDAPLLLLLPLLLKLQKFVVFAADGSAVQYHIRAAVQHATEYYYFLCDFRLFLSFSFSRRDAFFSG